MDEQRKYMRNMVNARVRLRHPGIGETEAMTLNISNGGVLAITPIEYKLYPGSELVMQFLDARHSDIEFNMRVVRNDKSGMGLEFDSFMTDGEVYSIGKLPNFWQD